MGHKYYRWQYIQYDMHCTIHDVLANLLNDEHSQETISDHVDAVVDLARAE